MKICLQDLKCTSFTIEQENTIYDIAVNPSDGFVVKAKRFIKGKGLEDAGADTYDAIEVSDQIISFYTECKDDDKWHDTLYIENLPVKLDSDIKILKI